MPNSVFPPCEEQGMASCPQGIHVVNTCCSNSIDRNILYTVLIEIFYYYYYYYYYY